MPDSQWSDEASSEVDEALSWYADRDPRVASDLLAEIDAADRAITDAPLRWPAYLKGTRRYLLPRFPYFLVYLASDHQPPRVVAFHHANRAPGYWFGRTT